MAVELTLTLEDDVYAKVQRLVARRQTDVSEVVADGLDDLLRTDDEIAVIGPVAPDYCWQALTHFFVDWEAKRVVCPQSHASQKWSQTHDQQRNPIIILMLCIK